MLKLNTFTYLINNGDNIHSDRENVGANLIIVRYLVRYKCKCLWEVIGIKRNVYYNNWRSFVDVTQSIKIYCQYRYEGFSLKTVARGAGMCINCLPLFDFSCPCHVDKLALIIMLNMGAVCAKEPILHFHFGRGFLHQ